MKQKVKVVSFRLKHPDKDGNEYVAIATTTSGATALYSDCRQEAYQVSNKQLLPSVGRTRREAINNLKSSLQNQADSVEDIEETVIRVDI